MQGQAQGNKSEGGEDGERPSFGPERGGEKLVVIGVACGRAKRGQHQPGRSNLPTLGGKIKSGKGLQGQEACTGPSSF